MNLSACRHGQRSFYLAFEVAHPAATPAESEGAVCHGGVFACTARLQSHSSAGHQLRRSELEAQGQGPLEVPRETHLSARIAPARARVFLHLGEIAQGFTAAASYAASSDICANRLCWSSPVVRVDRSHPIASAAAFCSGPPYLQDESPGDPQWTWP